MPEELATALLVLDVLVDVFEVVVLLAFAVVEEVFAVVVVVPVLGTHWL